MKKCNSATLNVGCLGGGVSFYCGKVIKRTRREKNISGFELGMRLNISQQQISRYERGLSKINIDVLADIANSLGIPLDTLIKLTFEEMKKNDEIILNKK
ncbi:TPA: helix-turn-helix domain-containing protein [Morganella morganii]|uniref:helix-turn-helix domain-containing protein n=1 Tax=Morganella morganii TaxID=582 RepID=UPI00228F0259|nr:helix-turn-helix transcriptional regulator [Morganella morganii]